MIQKLRYPVVFTRMTTLKTVTIRLHPTTRQNTMYYSQQHTSAFATAVGRTFAKIQTKTVIRICEVWRNKLARED